MNYVKTILDKIINKEIKFGIIGLGYVRLSLLIKLFKKKIYTISFDIEQNNIKKIIEGKLYKRFTITLK